jgi:tetratricopeptide (TPR) repeat protein
MNDFLRQLCGSRSGILCAVLLAGACGCGRDGHQLLDDGLEALQAGNDAEAVVLLEKAAAALPVNATAQCNLGLAYWRLGEHKSAVGALRIAADLDPGTAVPLELLVQVYGEMGQLEPARRAFDEAQQERATPSSRVLTAMALIEHRAGDPDVARDYLVQALDLDANYAPAAYNMACLFKERDEGRLEAEAYFKRFLALVDNADSAQAVAARDYLAGGKKPDPPDNGGSATQAVETVETANDTLVGNARKAIGNENLDEALVLLKEAVKRDPTHRDALWELVLLYDVGLKDTERANQYRALFVKRFPNDPMSRGRGSAAGAQDPVAAGKAFSKGVSCYRASDWNGAIKHYQNALLFDRTFCDASYNLGLAYKAKGQLDKARNEFLYTLQVKPDMADAAYMLALVHRTQKEPSRAIERLESLLKRTPDYAKAHLLLGYVYQDQRQSSKARTHFERYVKLAPPGDPSATKLKQWLRRN